MRIVIKCLDDLGVPDITITSIDEMVAFLRARPETTGWESGHTRHIRQSRALEELICQIPVNSNARDSNESFSATLEEIDGILEQQVMTNPTVTEPRWKSPDVSDHALSVEELEDKYNPDGDGEHPLFLRSDWRYAVANEDTTQGYWAWVCTELANILDNED